MTRIVVLGAGLVGKHIAADLADRFEVTAADKREDALEAAFAGSSVRHVVADLSDPARIAELVEPCDIVVNALPGFMGFAALRAILEAGKNAVDIAFFPEDAFELDELARSRGVTAIVDMGVAPGMGNLILGRHMEEMRKVEGFLCLVGGLPVERRWPFEYKAPFSPSDVIELYTRPARYVENGVEVVRPALTDPELVHIEGIGTLEALNTDGLRSLARTCDVPNMKEKTLRYPGHGRLVEALREAGFFDEEPIDVGGVSVSPLEVTSRILFPQWALGENEPEFTVMRITVRGVDGEGRSVTHVWDLLDHGDRVKGISSMARTTGYACTAAVNLLAAGEFSRKGICPPEYIGADRGCFDRMLAYQHERDLDYLHTVRTES